jgi:hypothetical protein
LFARLDPGFGRLAAVAEAIGLVARLDDVTVMRQAVEERGRHLGIAEDTGPLGEDQVRGDDHAGVLVQRGQQVKQQRATGLGEGQIAELVELCGAPHNSTNATSSVMWSARARMPPSRTAVSS